MREQVITPRSRGARESKGRGVAAQRPARKGGRGVAGGESAWRTALRFLPLALKVTACAAVGLVLFLGYRAASSASFFRLTTVEVEGASRTSPDEVKAIVRRHAAAVGVWRADLAAIGDELKRQPWVRGAVVSRVLPSGVRVRVAEREPSLVVRTEAGRFAWVDDEGVMLGPAQPSDRLPPFFVRGFNEAPTDAARADNRERVARALEMMREWQAGGLTNRVSEVNLSDLRDVRVQLTGGDSQIEVRLGGKDFGPRFAKALEKLDEVRRQRPEIVVTRLDATLAYKGGRVIVGVDPNAKATAADEPPAEPEAPADAGASAGRGARHAATARDAGTVSAESRGREPRGREEKRPAVRETQGARQGRDARAARPAGRIGDASAERPRRVG